MNFSLENFKSKVSDFIGGLGSTAANKTSGANQTATPSFWQRYALNFGSSSTASNAANNQALRQVAGNVETWRSDGDQIKKASLLPSPKAVIIPLKDGKKQAGYDELSFRVTLAALEQNGIHPSNIEMEELMALPASKNLDLNGWLDKKWEFHDLPGLMPEAGTFKDSSGKEVFGYKQTFSPGFQQSVIADYHKIKGDLALTPDKKAVIDMGMNERLVETVRIAYGKGYISQEIKNQLGSVTPEELAATFAIGGAIGIAAGSAEASLVLGPVGAGAGLAYSVKQMAEFGEIAKGAAKAVNRDQLDKPAKEFGQWMGQLSKDGVLAIVGAAGAVTAPRVMPRVEQVITSKAAGVKEALAESKITNLGEPELATPEGARIKTATARTPLEKINDPKKIVTVDSDGKPSGTRFRDDYETHIKEREFSKVSQSKGVNGAHNMKELEQYDIAVSQTLTKESINITSKTPHPTMKGIYKIEYQMPTLDRAQNPTGGWRNWKGTDPFVKTVYDPAIISDKQMAQWGREAFAEAQAAGRVGSREWTGYTPNGLKIHGYIDEQGTKAVRGFFVEF